jgi:hypothetical protein
MKKDSNSLLRTWRTTPVRRFSRTEIVVASLFFFLLFFLLPLKYDNIKAKTFLYPIIWISSAFVVYRTFPKPSELRTFIFTIGGGLCFLYALLNIPNLIGFCALRDHGTLYINRKDPSRRIIMTGYSCFLTDDDIQLYQERTITEHIKWVTSFDEKPVDTTKWQFHPE